MVSLRYYEHYLRRLRESVARGPAASHVLPVLDLFEAPDPETRFRLVQQLERLLRDVDPATIDWVEGRRRVAALLAGAPDPEEFGRRLRGLAGT